MPRDWSEVQQESGWTEDRKVQCGLPGKIAYFSLGHGWGDSVDPPESSAEHFYGFREDVDPEIINRNQESHPSAKISLERWHSKQETFLRAIGQLEEGVRIHSSSANGDSLRRSLGRMSQEPLAELSEPEFDWRIAASSCVSSVTGVGFMTRGVLEDPGFLPLWQEAVAKAMAILPTLLVKAQERERLAKLPQVTFRRGRDGSPMATVDGKISFPQRGFVPQVGETWYVEVAGQNRKGTVNFLRPVKKVD